MIHKKLTINSDEGLQSRSAALLVQVAGDFASNIWIEQANKRVNAKSIMGVLSLRLRRGDSFVIAASGNDEEGAVAAITRLIEKGEAGR
jgi:phosphotransferase system HPr (HPr) family protein